MQVTATQLKVAEGREPLVALSINKPQRGRGVRGGEAKQGENELASGSTDQVHRTAGWDLKIVANSLQIDSG